MPQAKIVQIQRGQYAPYFQVTRAWISAASALVHIKPVAAVNYLDDAIAELKELRSRIVAATH